MGEPLSADQPPSGVEACFLAMREAQVTSVADQLVRAAGFSAADAYRSLAMALKQTPQQAARSRFRRKAIRAAKQRAYALALASPANRPLLFLLRGEFGFAKPSRPRKARV